MALAYPSSRFEPPELVDLNAKGERERLSVRPARVFQDGGALEDARRGRPRTAGRPFEQRLLRMEEKSRPRARGRPHHAHLLPAGIYKALHILYGDKLADEWVKLPNKNPMFGGRTPLAYMLGGGLLAMQTVRKLLDARRGGGAALSLPLPRTTLPAPVRHLPPASLALRRRRGLGARAARRGRRAPRDLFELDNATNERLRGQRGCCRHRRRRTGVRRAQFRIVNAAYTYAHPQGSRFNDRSAAPGIARSRRKPHWPKSPSTRASSTRRSALRRQRQLPDCSPISPTTSTTCAGSALRACLDPASYIASQQLADAPDRKRLAGRDLPQRPARRRHQPGLLPARGGRQCASRRRLSIDLVRPAHAEDRACAASRPTGRAAGVRVSNIRSPHRPPHAESSAATVLCQTGPAEVSFAHA